MGDADGRAAGGRAVEGGAAVGDDGDGRERVGDGVAEPCGQINAPINPVRRNATRLLIRVV